MEALLIVLILTALIVVGIVCIICVELPVKRTTTPQKVTVIPEHTRQFYEKATRVLHKIYGGSMEEHASSTKVLRKVYGHST